MITDESKGVFQTSAHQIVNLSIKIGGIRAEIKEIIEELETCRGDVETTGQVTIFEYVQKRLQAAEREMDETIERLGMLSSQPTKK